MVGRFGFSMSDAEYEVLTEDEIDEGKEITLDRFYDWIKIQYDALILLPLRHCGDGDLAIDYEISPEDRRFAGVFYSTKKDIEKMQGKSDDKAIENELACIEADIDILNAWGRGECFGYRIFPPTNTVEDKYLDNEDDIDSCWGYYGDDIKENGLMDSAKDFIEWHIKDQEKQIAEMKNPIQLEKFIAGE